MMFDAFSGADGAGSVEPVADPSADETLSLVRNVPDDGYDLLSPAQRLVAFLPAADTVENLICGQRLLVVPERQPGGWAMVARASAGGYVVGEARTSWWPAAYRLWLSDEAFWLVKLPGTAQWRLGQQHTTYLRIRLARSTVEQSRVWYHPDHDGTRVGSIDVREVPLASRGFTTLIVLAIQTIRADYSIPGAGGGAGG